MAEAVLPRIKTKRKRRKPPWALILCLFMVMVIAWAMYVLASAIFHDPPVWAFIDGLFFGWGIHVFNEWWKLFKAELKRWKDDE